MDDLTRAAQQLLDRPELAPPPIEFVERRAQRHQRRVRTGIATGVSALALVLVLVVALVAHDPTERRKIVTTEPTTVAPPPTAPAQTLRSHSFTRGDFDVTEYTVVGTSKDSPISFAVTRGQVWLANGNHLFRFDMARGDLSPVLTAGDLITAVDASADAVYVLESTFVNVGVAEVRVVAVDAGTGEVRWRSVGSISDAPSSLATDGNTLWVGRAHEHGGELQRLDPRTGRVLQRLEVPSAPGSIVATPTRLWIGNYRALDRVDLVPTPVVTHFEFADSFEVQAADSTGVWGMQQSGDHEDPSFFRRVGNDGRVLAILPCNALSLRREGAWCARAGTPSATVSLIDPRTGAVDASGAVQVGVVRDVDGVGWSVDGYRGVIVRITRR
jgi:hypothetical protein